MADERQLNVTTRLDATGLRAGMDEAAAAVQQGAAKMDASFASATEASAALAAAQKEMAAILATVGGSISESNAAWGIYSEAATQAAAAQAAVAEFAKDAAASVDALDKAQKEAAASATAMGSAEAYASARIAASASGMGSMGFALGAVARQSSTLRPLLEDIFPIVLAGAFADVLVNIGESIKTWYDNAVLLKQLNEDLLKASESAANAAAAKNWEYIDSLIAVKKALGEDAGAVDVLRSHILEQPLKINLDIKDKDLQQAESILGGISKLVGEVRGSNTLGTGEALVGPLTSELNAAKQRLQELQQQLQRQQQAQDEYNAAVAVGAGAQASGLAQDIGNIGETQANIEALTKTVHALNSALGQIGSAKGTAGNDIWKAQQDGANKAAEGARKAAQAARELATATDGAAKATARLDQRWTDAGTKFARESAVALAESLRTAEQGAGREAESVIRALNQQAKAAKEAWEDTQRATKEAMDGQRQHIQATTSLDVAKIREQGATHAITAKQEAAELTAAYQQEHDALVALLNAEEAALDPSSKNYLSEKQRIENEKQQADDRLASNLQSAQTVAAKTDAKQWAQFWQSSIDAVSASFSRMFESVISGHERMRVAAGRAVDELAAHEIESILKIELQALTADVRRVVQHTLANQAKVASDGTAAAESDAISSASAFKQALHFAGLAATKTFAAIAGIPIVGPFLAPEAAGAAYVGALAFASAEGGQWSVPFDGQMTMLHANEMVLPAVHAQALREMLSSGNGAGGHTVHVHMHNHVNAVDSRGVARVLKDNHQAVADAVGHHLRQLNKR